MKIVQVPFDSSLGRRAKALRVEVFVEEQKVPPDLELDEYDPAAVHLVACEESAVLGTLRIVDYFHENHRVAKIGRVAVAATHRRKGVGRQLMLAAIAHAENAAFPQCFLTAQVHVIAFYEKLGFVPHGPIFDDCGIPHRAMTLQL